MFYSPLLISLSICFKQRVGRQIKTKEHAAKTKGY